MARVDKVKTDLAQKMKQINIGEVTFKYSSRCLKIKTSWQIDHRIKEDSIKKQELDTTHSILNLKFLECVFRGLPGSTDSGNIIFGLRQKGIYVTHFISVKKATKREGVISVKALPVCVVSLENIP